MSDKGIEFQKNHRCPKCGWECNSPDEGLIITFDKFNGTYCMYCWAKSISDNIPKMEKITDEKQMD